MDNKKQAYQQLCNYAFENNSKGIKVFQLHFAFAQLDGWEEADLEKHGFTLTRVSISPRKTQNGNAEKDWVSEDMNIWINNTSESRLRIGTQRPDKNNYTLADIYNEVKGSPKCAKFFYHDSDKRRRNFVEMLTLETADMTSEDGDLYTWARVNTNSREHNHVVKKVVLTHVNGTYIADIFKNKNLKALADRVTKSATKISMMDMCQIEEDTTIITRPYCANHK